MTETELDALLADCPTLYHMAERGSWPAIAARGLLSTTALLDLYAVPEPARSTIERDHRPEGVTLRAEGLPPAVVRDQKPMSRAGLERCLPARLAPEDWLALLNAKVFFWLSEARLHRLTGAKAYRDDAHDVLEIDARSLVDAHRERIWLCPINSGATKPFGAPRDETSFARIEDYDYAHWRAKRPKGERVVELAVDHAVPDIARHVRRVVVKRGTETVAVLHEAAAA
ncbi:MAG: hypothetical protein ACFBWO_07605 [Paracoccaceae bacterium]